MLRVKHGGGTNKQFKILQSIRSASWTMPIMYVVPPLKIDWNDKTKRGRNHNFAVCPQEGLIGLVE